MAGKKKIHIPFLVQVIMFLIILLGIPVSLVLYQSVKSGLSTGEVISSLFKKGSEHVELTKNDFENVKPPGKAEDFTDYPVFLKPQYIGNPIEGNPMISHLTAADINSDGLQDIIIADAQFNCISLLVQNANGQFQEIKAASDIIAPSHVQAFDFDKDGDLDILVSVLGMIFPNNDKIGSVVLLLNEGQLKFSKHILIEKIARASDVRGGDMDKDGDIDLVVAQFGYDDGETRWMENLGNLRFKSHILQTLSGGINCDIYDFNNDGNLDIALLVSQEWEEIYIFLNDGKGNFTTKLIYGSPNSDFGSSSTNLYDLDLDGDMDILYTNGDAFDYIPPRPRPWHGIQWLENKGDLKFEMHRLADFGGASNAKVVDVDHDGDMDIFVVSEFNLWINPESRSFIWLENIGNMQYVKHPVSNNPTHLLTLDIADFNKDGEIDFVTGGMHVYPPFDRKSRITLWINKWPELKIKK